jgi:hypothetical protein
MKIDCFIYHCSLKVISHFAINFTMAMYPPWQPKDEINVINSEANLRIIIND